MKNIDCQGKERTFNVTRQDLIGADSINTRSLHLSPGLVLARVLTYTSFNWLLLEGQFEVFLASDLCMSGTSNTS